ncbi:MAG: amidohydrolase, partial [Alphaproteobacteria bacterium]|nr:amidohydrolase [Alphaproteobacteria bacterium]
TMPASRQRVVALEEHYGDPEIMASPGFGRDLPGGRIREGLLDVGAMRLQAMDEAGVDLQVLSHVSPSLQRFDAGTAVRLARGVNDRLRDTCAAHPGRFAGFAALPTADPLAAADELERAVTKLGFRGAMLHGLSNGVFLDDRRFWPVFERAAALDVPIYIHPAAPHPAVVDAYYKDYAADFWCLTGPAWAFAVETGTQAVRMVLSGVFDRYPNLKVILGHLGEGVPFMLWRLDYTLKWPGNKPVAFRDTFCDRFWVTTSGFFSDPALQCTIAEMGVDHVLFSVDWPFVANAPGTDWLNRLQLAPADKAKITGGNAERLLKL